MNRDERRNRAAEWPPRRRLLAAGREWWGPVDGEGGGTWFGLHSDGWTACLMNRYAGVAPESRNWSSRGEIIPYLMSSGNLTSARTALRRRLPSARYRPFTLLLGSPEGVWLAAWEDQRLSDFVPAQSGWNLWTSSSWKEPEVRRWRRRRFAEWLAGGAAFEGDLPRFHLLQPAGESAWSPLMARSETHTRSITQVRIEPGAPEAVMNYWPSPQAFEAGPAVRIEVPAQPDPAIRDRHG